MINYNGLPQRVRRIVKTYENCIESVEIRPEYFFIALKTGYITKGGFTVITTDYMEDLIYMLKNVTKPSFKVIRTALYGFSCPLCNQQVHKGSNYTDLGGMRICSMHE